MVAAADNHPLTKQAYLALEHSSPERHEYVAGQGFPSIPQPLPPKTGGRGAGKLCLASPTLREASYAHFRRGGLLA